MEQIRDGISILKARWPEVFLILGIYVLFPLDTRPFQRLFEVSPQLGLLICVCMLPVIVLMVMLPQGFLRSVHLEGHKRHPPLALLRLGKHFFWRAVGVGLLFSVAYVMLAWLVFLLAREPLAITTDFRETAKTDRLLHSCCFAVSQLILIKPMLLVMPIVIVTDCRILAGFGLLKRCKLYEAEGLVVVFVTSVAFTMLLVFVQPVQETWTISYYVLRIPLSITQQLIGLMMAVMAVRFVGSRNLLNEADADLPDLGDASS